MLLKVQNIAYSNTGFRLPLFSYQHDNCPGTFACGGSSRLPDHEAGSPFHHIAARQDFLRKKYVQGRIAGNWYTAT